MWPSRWAKWKGAKVKISPATNAAASAAPAVFPFSLLPSPSSLSTTAKMIQRASRNMP